MSSFVPTRVGKIGHASQIASGRLPYSEERSTGKVDVRCLIDLDVDRSPLVWPLDVGATAPPASSSGSGGAPPSLAGTKKSLGGSETHRQQCLSPRERWRNRTSSTSTLIFPSHHPLHVSHITAKPEENVCRYLTKSIHAGGHALQITRYTCILDVTLDPPNAWIIYPNYEIHFY
jgi:hypothetical protein